MRIAFAYLFVCTIICIGVGGCSGGGSNSSPPPVSYSISGNVTWANSGLQGVSVVLSGKDSASTTTDAGGNFSFSNLANGNYTVTPSKQGYTFSASNAQIVNGANVTGVNFTGVVTSQSKLPIMRAMNIGGNWGGNIDGFKNLSDSYIQSLLADNVNWVLIKIPIFNESISDPTVKVRYRPAGDNDYANMYTFNDSDLIKAVTRLRQNGINVYLSLCFIQPKADQTATCGTALYGVDPHLFGDPQLPTQQNSSVWGYECINSSMWWWNPSHPNYATNIATFWSSYTQVAVKYAIMAQQLGAGMFKIGEETDRLFRTRSSARFPIHFKNELSQMVAAVRAEYSGLVTYGQVSSVHLPHPEWWGADKEASYSLYKDLGLDVIDIHGYYSLLTSNVDRVYSVAEFEPLWASVFNDYLVPLQLDNINTPILFGDTGAVDAVNILNSSLSGSGDPFIYSDLNGNGIDDGREQQANFFRSFINVNKSYDYLLRGTFFTWLMIDNGYALTHRSIDLNGKPAEQVIRDAYNELKSVAQ